MSNDSSLSMLRKISKPLTFPKGTTICREGMPGLRMYIIIQGRVGVYINTILDERVKVEEVHSGGFFGEMSILDKLPRSATCIALEDTICIAINNGNLREFIVKCPDMAEKLMLSISTRLRTMNDQLYKSPTIVTSGRFDPFRIPTQHKPHFIDAPEANPRCLVPYQDVCPCCGKDITLEHLQTYSLSLLRMENNLRRIYREVDVLWHYLWTCSECGYTNFNTHFHQVSEKHQKVLQHLVDEEMRYHENSFKAGSDFDELVFHYFQAIHINTCLNSGDTLLIGKLWLYLHWLYEDIHDNDMTTFARDQALTAYLQAYDSGPRILKSDDAQQQCAQVIAELYLEKEDYENARNFYSEVLKYNGPLLCHKAHDRIYEIRQLRKQKKNSKTP